MRTLATLATLGALFYSPVADACSCIAPDLKQQWHESSDMLGVKILAERVMGGERQFKARVIQPFSGCLQAGDIIALTTAIDSATCGTSYTIGATYVISASDSGNMVSGYEARSVNSCGWASLYSTMSNDDLDFLYSRPVECAGALTCADGAPPVSCLVDPCTLASCVDGDCESNNCGGTCTAEFYDFGGYPVCEPW